MESAKNSVTPAPDSQSAHDSVGVMTLHYRYVCGNQRCRECAREVYEEFICGSERRNPPPTMLLPTPNRAQRSKSCPTQGKRMKVCDPIAGALPGRARAPKPC